MEFLAVLRVDQTPLPPFEAPSWRMVSFTGTGRLYAGSQAFAAGGDVTTLEEGVDFVEVSDFNATRFWEATSTQADSGARLDVDEVFDCIQTLRAGDMVSVSLDLAFRMTDKKRKVPQFRVTALEILSRATDRRPRRVSVPATPAKR